MASTTFIDQQTVIYAAWLNDTNNAVYNGIFAATTISPTNIVCNGSVSGTGFTSLVNNVFSSPAPIGNATPNTGAFTTLSATTSLTLNGVAVDTISGANTLTNKTLTTPIIGTIKSTSTTSPTVFQNSAGTEIGQLIKAWVVFDGTTSPPTIRSSFNVASVTKYSTGQYSVTMTNAMTDKNYVVLGSVINGTTPAVNGASYVGGNDQSGSTPGSQTTTTFNIGTFSNGTSFADFSYINILVMR